MVDQPVRALNFGMRTLGQVAVEIQQFPLPLTAELQILTLHLQTLYIPTPTLVVKSIRPSPTVWTIKLSIPG